MSERRSRKRRLHEQDAELDALREEMKKMKERFEAFESKDSEDEVSGSDTESSSSEGQSFESGTETETLTAGKENNEPTKRVSEDDKAETGEPQPNEELLQLLGDDPQQSKALDLRMHSSLKSRWEHYIKKGLNETEEKDLLAKYKRPEFLQVPQLNAEIKTILKESAVKRDNYMSEVHQLAGAALTSLGDLLSTLMTEKESIDQMTFFERIRDAASLLVEICYRQTESRKAFVVPGLSKEFKNLATEAQTDNFLFGQEFSSKIKETESLEKITKKMRRPVQFNQKTTALNFKSLSGKRPPLSQTGNSNASGPARPRLFFRPRPQTQRYNQSQYQGKFKPKNNYK